MSRKGARLVSLPIPSLTEGQEKILRDRWHKKTTGEALFALVSGLAFWGALAENIRSHEKPKRKGKKAKGG